MQGEELGRSLPHPPKPGQLGAGPGPVEPVPACPRWPGEGAADAAGLRLGLPQCLGSKMPPSCWTVGTAPGLSTCQQCECFTARLH